MESEINVIEKLASTLNRRDEEPNIELAKEIISKNDEKAVATLVANLKGKTAIQNDCIKVLYEIGERQPELIANYLQSFVDLLSSKNNRMQWGAMTAIDTICTVHPKGVFEVLPTLLFAANKGSVITKDHAVNILIKLSALNEYGHYVFGLLMEQLSQCATNQLPMYAEKTIPVIADHNRELFINTLQMRLVDVEKESKRKRLEKVIKKVGK
ncbi:hypothetical protein GC194_04505 [bacterium]|nr:hypothetical protein [bacterium]